MSKSRFLAVLGAILFSPLGAGHVAAAPFGATLPDPVPLNNDAAVEEARDSEPEIAGDGAGTWLAVWRSDNSLDGTIGSDGDLFFARSEDGGVTWSGAQPLSPNAASDGGDDGEPALATDGAGVWIVAWSSTTNLGGVLDADTDILVARSDDDGATWGAAQPLGLAAGDAREDRQPVVEADGAGNWIVGWSSWTAGPLCDSDVFFVRSVDAGLSWSPQASLVSAPGSCRGSPSIRADGSGIWMALLRQGRAIDVVRSLDGGATWGDPQLLHYAAGGTVNSPSLNGDSLATDGAGAWVAVWYSNDDPGGFGADADLFVARSLDGGVSWSAPAVLNTNASFDAGWDGPVSVAADRFGNWVVAWQSLDSLGGTIGNDSDVLLSRSVDAGATWTDPEPADPDWDPIDAADFDVVLATDGLGAWLAVWSSWFAPCTEPSDLEVALSRFYLPFPQTCATDADGDGYGFPGDPACPRGALDDCNDLDFGTWAAPGEARDLRAVREGGEVFYRWLPPAEAGGEGLTYDVLRSADAGAFDAGGECLFDSAPADREIADALVPPPGAAFFYLARARNACPLGDGSLGTDSTGTPRQGPLCP